MMNDPSLMDKVLRVSAGIRGNAVFGERVLLTGVSDYVGGRLVKSLNVAAYQ